jgi:hypothetical protein
LKLAIALLVMASTALAQDNAPKPPQITDAQRAQYWRAQAEVLAAQTAAQRAAQAFEVTLKGLQEYCGPTQELQSVNGEPFCKLKKTEASSAAR